MSKKFVAIIIAVLVIASGFLYLFIGNQKGFTGDRIKNPDLYSIDFKFMNEEDTHVLNLKNGDKLEVDFAVTKGKVDLIIFSENSDVYKGNDIKSGSFELIIPEDGEYNIVVNAKKASGTLSIELKK